LWADTGTLAIELARRGATVTAFDGDPDVPRRARAKPAAGAARITRRRAARSWRDGVLIQRHRPGGRHQLDHRVTVVLGR